MNTKSFCLLSVLFVILLSVCPLIAEDTRPRIVVLTDITNEPDDQESLVRFLVYANEFKIEGLVATTSTWLRDRTSVQNIKDCVAAYGKVRENLSKHAKGFPTQAELDAVTLEGRPEFGMQGVGEGKDTAGSNHIIKVIDRDDDRPVWVTAWGGSNCLAQALWKVRETRSQEAVDKFVAKIRVYTISDQDDAGPWMRREFPSLFFVVSPSGERGAEYHEATWTGISGDDHYLNGPRYKIDLVSNEWLLENVRTNHGPLGEMYPKWEYIMEGDTPSYMNLINNGLGSHVNPGYGGWGGRYFFKQIYGFPGKMWTNSRDAVTTPDGVKHVSNQATIWRWREDFQLDFAARMDWCVKSPKDANHNPVAVIDGDETKDVLHKTAKPGETVKLDASASSDRDGDTLSFRWFHYPEAGRDLANSRQQYTVPIVGVDSANCQITVPEKLPRGSDDIHVILRVTDDGNPKLVSYRRVVVTQNSD